jgi:hypothetical protein
MRKKRTLEFFLKFVFMDKAYIIETIKTEKPYLQDKFGVEEIALFGSYMRGDQEPDSDIDILVKFNNRSLTSYFGLLDFLQAKLKRKIDLVTKHKNLSERLLYFANQNIEYV